MIDAEVGTNVPYGSHLQEKGDWVFLGMGAKDWQMVETETQRWQVSLCLKAPATAAEEAVFIEDAGVLCLKLREALQGWKPTPSARGMVCTGYQPLLT